MKREPARVIPAVGAVRSLSRPARRALGVAVFAALTALGARLAVPLPDLAVPLTLQVVAVLLAGALLGPRLGAASQVAYLAAGLAGAPVFAAGGGAAYLLGPTGGYLLAFPAAAAVAGWLVGEGSGLVRSVFGLALALAIIHLAGLAWLAIIAGPQAARAVGVAPFLAGDALKIALVLALSRGPTGTTRRFFR